MMNKAGMLILLCYALAPLTLTHASERCGSVTALPVSQEHTSQAYTYQDLRHQAPQEQETDISFLLYAGKLKPQLDTLLKQHWQVQEVIWKTEHYHEWPTVFEATAASWEQLLIAILKPYRLQVIFHKNHIAVVQDVMRKPS